MKRFTAPLIALAAGATLLLGSHPAQAHGSAAGGLMGGLAHPLLGVDHLLLLLAVGAAASLLSGRLLVWAAVGAVVGAMAGVGGLLVPAAEMWAALAVAALGGLILAAVRGRRTGSRPLGAGDTDTPDATSSLRGLDMLGGPLVAASVAIHALLHGQEAPAGEASLLWWSGALISSVLVCGGTFQLVRKLPRAVIRTSP